VKAPERQDHVWNREYKRRGTSWSGLTKHLPDLAGKKVLETGCGNGKTLAGILEKNPLMAVAQDYSVQAVKKTRSIFPYAMVIQSDIERLPFRDCSFDAVTAFYVLDNMLVDKRALAADEIERVLKPGGQVIFEDFAVGDFRHKNANILGRPEENTNLKVKGLLCHYFSCDEVRGLFSRMEVKSLEEVARAPVRNRPHIIRRKVRALLQKSI
jgi:ubiquinone/menaquinone biosynthesis C-methylase UbiE